MKECSLSNLLLVQTLFIVLFFKGIGRRRLEASTIKVVVQVAITFVAAWAVLASATWAVSPATAKPKCQMGVHCRFR